MLRFIKRIARALASNRRLSELVRDVGPGTRFSVAALERIVIETIPFVVWSASFGLGFSATSWLLGCSFHASLHWFAPAAAMGGCFAANCVNVWEILLCDRPPVPC